MTLYIYSIWRLKWVFSWKKFNAILNYKTGESMRVWFWRFLFRNTLVYGSYKLTFIRERENFTRFVVKIHRRSLYRTVVKLTRILFAKFSRWKQTYLMDKEIYFTRKFLIFYNYQQNNSFSFFWKQFKESPKRQYRISAGLRCNHFIRRIWKKYMRILSSNQLNLATCNVDV